MINDEKKSGIDPVFIFILISLIIHGILFYFIPKLPKPPQYKNEKPISVKFIEEPVKGKKKPPKKATVLGKENITVKKETRPENKPKVTGQKKIAKLLPPPPPPPKPKVEAKKPEIKLTPIPKKPPAPPKKEIKPAPKPKPAPKKEIKKVKPLPKPEKPKPKVEKPKEKIITTPKKAKIKIAKPKPKEKVARKKPEKRQPRPHKKPPLTQKPPAPARPKVASRTAERPPSPGLLPGISKKNKSAPPPVPTPRSLFPSPETLHQLERQFSHTYPKNVNKGDTVSLNTRDFRYISYFTHIKHKIELVWEYPQRAAEMGQQGSLLLKFTILKDGRLAGVWLLQSSGYRLLDQEALRAVKDAAPFNPIPKRLHKIRLNILATFNYTLGYKFVY